MRAKKRHLKNREKYLSMKMMNRRFKNSKIFSNIKCVGDDGLLELKTGGYASLIEIKAIDLSLSSNQEKSNFFNYLKGLYQIKDLNLKCYKLDEKINLNNNKLNLNRLIEKFKNYTSKVFLLDENKRLIEELEDNNFTVSSIYYLVLIAKDLDVLERQLDEIEEILANIQPKIIAEVINNRLEVYKFLSNLYMTNNPLDLLMWSNLPELTIPLNLVEKTNMLKVDDKEVQMVTIKNIAPFIDELFFEEIFNYPSVRACINIKDAIDQEELISWVNSQYQFLLSDRNSTKKLSDATELDTQKENFQMLMNDIKSGDEKIKEVSLILAVIGNKKERDEVIRDLKRIVERYQIKLDIPRLRQMETYQCYDITPNSLKDYSIYLPTLTLSAGFPFTKTYFNDSTGYMLGVDIHTSLPTFFDPFVINNKRTSHNIAIVSSTGGGKSFTMKKMIVLIVSVTFSSVLVAQVNSTYYGRNGSYQGSSTTRTTGNTRNTSYYGNNGSYQGSSSSTTTGNTRNTSYYGNNGSYQGSSSSTTIGNTRNTSYYGNNGSYQGTSTSTTNGNTTTTYHYGANGSYQGSSTSTRNGNTFTTTHYGANGSYQGSTTTTVP